VSAPISLNLSSKVMSAEMRGGNPPERVRARETREDARKKGDQQHKSQEINVRRRIIVFDGTQDVCSSLVPAKLATEEKESLNIALWRAFLRARHGAGTGVWVEEEEENEHIK
jgi:hypothetical protein